MPTLYGLHRVKTVLKTLRLTRGLRGPEQLAMREFLVFRPTAAGRDPGKPWASLVVESPGCGILTKHISRPSTKLEYRPLGDNGIRFINIREGRGSDPIACEMYYAEELVLAHRGDAD